MSTSQPDGRAQDDGRDGSVDPRRDVFDAAHYRSQLHLARRWKFHVLGHDELGHFLERGWRLGLDPSPWFSTEGYLDANPDVRSAGVDPLTHWVGAGRAEGRPVVSPAEFADPCHVTPLVPELAARRDELVDHLAGFGLVVDPTDLDAPLLGRPTIPPDWFDEVRYRVDNPDVVADGVDAFSHYVRFGFRERRWPNVDIAIRAGATGSPVDRILAARDVRTETADRLSQATVVTDPPSAVFDRIGRALAGRERRLVLVVGHDDYTANVGGVQLCEGLEQLEFARRGLVHVFLHPSVPLRTLHPVDGEPLVRIVLDGVALDLDVSLSDLVGGWPNSGLVDVTVEAIVVHSVLGHSPERIGDVIRAVEPRRSVWWVHDSSAKCPNWSLLRNGVEPCGAPPPTSTSCRLCAWGPERTDHRSRLRDLWSQAPWEFAAPSESAAIGAMAGSDALPVEPVVVPHLGLRRVDEDRPPSGTGRRTVRIGFIGEPRPEKGWDVFVALARSAPPECEFVHLGGERGPGPDLEFVELRQTADTFGSTVEAVRSNRLDAVLVWTRSVETFGLVAVEAIAGGCEILTHRGSGNVLVMAERHDRAVVYDSVEDLMAADLSADLRARRRTASPAWEIVTGSGLTPAVLDRTGSSVTS